MATRTSFRPRPLDHNKQIEIIRDFALLDSTSADAAGLPQAVTLESIIASAEAFKSKRSDKDIPIPEVRRIPTHYRDYLPLFKAPPTYARAKHGGYLSEDVVEYDLDNEDEDWWEASGLAAKMTAEKFERMLWKLELACAAATEAALTAAGANHQERHTATAVAAIDHMGRAEALEVLRMEVGGRPSLLRQVYDYWAGKRKRWGKPLLRRLQAPTSATDTNPHLTFRARDRVNRPQTRRRRENTEECAEKLRQIRDNIRDARDIMGQVCRRERRKRDILHAELELLKIRIKHRHDHSTAPDKLAHACMERLKASLKNNQNNDARRQGVEMLANGMTLHMYTNGRPMKRRRHGEVQPFLRDYMARVEMAPLPPDEEQLFCLTPALGKLMAQASQQAARMSQRGGGGGDPGGAPPPLLALPPGADVGALRPRIGRLGRLVLDRVDPLTGAPLQPTSLVVEDSPGLPSMQQLVAQQQAAAAAAAAVQQQGGGSGSGAAAAAAAAAAMAEPGGTETWFQMPTQPALRELVEALKPPNPPLPRPRPPLPAVAASLSRSQATTGGATAAQLQHHYQQQQRLGSSGSVGNPHTAAPARGAGAGSGGTPTPAAAAPAYAGGVGPKAEAPPPTEGLAPSPAHTAPKQEPRQASAPFDGGGGGGGADENGAVGVDGSIVRRGLTIVKSEASGGSGGLPPLGKRPSSTRPARRASANGTPE